MSSSPTTMTATTEPPALSETKNNKKNDPTKTTNGNNNKNNSSSSSNNNKMSKRKLPEPTVTDNNTATTTNNNTNKTSSKPTLPLTIEGEMPQKKFFRSRAHCNPLSHNDTFSYPPKPDPKIWWSHYPELVSSSSSDDKTTTTTTTISPNVLDIGCGFGGLTITLATLLPEHVILGLEIRAKVTEYVRLRIMALRKENPTQYQNCSVMRSNAMKYLPKLFTKASMDKLFFCFPDPHFKKKNHPRRIISSRLLSEYAYLLKIGGRLYCVTDVEELHRWHVEMLESHPLFRRVEEEERERDACVKAMVEETEEGKKVERAGSEKYFGVYERIECDDDGSGLMEGGKSFWDEGQFGVWRKGG